MKQKKFKNVILVFFLILLWSPTTAENRALIIGIADYSDDSLKGPEKDPELMKEIAIKIGFKESQIRILNGKVTKENILFEFKNWLVNGVNPDDKVLFYYSGHGGQLRDMEGDENDGCDEALVPSDERMISDDEICEMIEKVPSKQMLIILDSCFSGTATRFFGTSTGKMWKPVNQECNRAINRKSIAVVDEKVSSDKYVLITAAAQNEIANGNLEDEKGKGSLFTLAIYDTIQKRKEGPLSLTDLRDRAAEYIIDACDHYDLIPQTPQIEGNSRWFSKDIFSFAKQDYRTSKDMKADEKGNSKTNLEYFKKVVGNSQFLVIIKSPKRTYEIEDKIIFTITSSKSGYLNILDIDPTGEIGLIFPNQLNSRNEIEAEMAVMIPGPKVGEFKFEAMEPIGESYVVAIVTEQCFNLYNEKVGTISGLFKIITEKETGKLDEIITGKIRMAPDNKNEFGAGGIRVTIEKKN